MTESSKDNSTHTQCECLPAPIFRFANENNAINARSKVATPIDIPPYHNLQVGDIIALHLIGFNKLEGGELIEAADFKQAFMVIEDNLEKGFDLFIPGRILYAIGYGRAQAYVEVSRAGMTSRSVTAHVLIDMREGGVFLP